MSESTSDGRPTIVCEHEGCGLWFFASAGRQFGGLIDGWVSVFDDTLHRFRDYCGQHRDDAKRRPA